MILESEFQIRSLSCTPGDPPTGSAHWTSPLERPPMPPTPQVWDGTHCFTSSWTQSLRAFPLPVIGVSVPPDGKARKPSCSEPAFPYKSIHSIISLTAPRPPNLLDSSTFLQTPPPFSLSSIQHHLLPEILPDSFLTPVLPYSKLATILFLNHKPDHITFPLQRIHSFPNTLAWYRIVLSNTTATSYMWLLSTWKMARLNWEGL